MNVSIASNPPNDPHAGRERPRRRSAAMILGLAFVVVASALGCEANIPEGRFTCGSNEDCPPGLVCRTNVSRCYETLLDAGPPRDAGSTDAGG